MKLIQQFFFSPMQVRHFASVVLLVFSTHFCSAQKSETGNWFIYSGSQSFQTKWNWANEVQYRSYNFAGDMQQFLVRTGIGFNLSENNNNILLGYGFIRSENYQPDTNLKTGFNEHRIYQQFVTRQNFGRVFIQHRYRLEERFLPNDVFKLRFRYFLAVNIPINNATMIKNTVYISAYNEIFINGKTPFFDRDRVYGAVGFVITQNIKAEIGFMSQVLDASRRNQFQVVLYNTIPFRKH
ncbi:MAG TPA: DUF2490 domain-containing protein [Bacteroidia bacterium]|nr:DUF2490 domain-containing protein [Bacteroidia bacterium]